MILDELTACTKACCRMTPVAANVIGSRERMLQSCVASACNGWRLYPGVIRSEKTGQLIPLGYCGLAGIPTVQYIGDSQQVMEAEKAKLACEKTQ